MSEGAVKVAVHRLRRRFRDSLLAEIAETVADPEQVEEEMRFLLSVVSATSSSYQPPIHLGDPDKHFINAGAFISTVKTLVWLFTSAPPEIRSMSMGLLGDVGQDKSQPAPSAG
jgi:hypothetical protein